LEGFTSCAQPDWFCGGERTKTRFGCDSKFLAAHWVISCQITRFIRPFAEIRFFTLRRAKGDGKTAGVREKKCQSYCAHKNKFKLGWLIFGYR